MVTGFGLDPKDHWPWLCTWCPQANPWTIHPQILTNTTLTRAKHVLPNIHRTQGRRNHPRHATEWSRRPMRDVICSERILLCRCQGVMEVTRFFVPGEHDLWPWSSPEQGTKHVSPVNLAQIRSAIPEIFDAQTKNETTRNVGQCPTWWSPCRI